mmetsp:Transcript_17464/g.59953  ORF Transcript_17464/g.59953 Transcript_17464/m.59953 type:complete len:254 (+) Transcript_17464:548-1309(+)
MPRPTEDLTCDCEETSSMVNRLNMALDSRGRGAARRGATRLLRFSATAELNESGRNVPSLQARPRLRLRGCVRRAAAPPRAAAADARRRRRAERAAANAEVDAALRRRLAHHGVRVRRLVYQPVRHSRSLRDFVPWLVLAREARDQGRLGPEEVCVRKGLGVRRHARYRHRGHGLHDGQQLRGRRGRRHDYVQGQDRDVEVASILSRVLHLHRPRLAGAGAADPGPGGWRLVVPLDAHLPVRGRLLLGECHRR